MNNGMHKSQFKLFGRSLIYWTLKGLQENGITDVLIVVSKDSSMQHMLEQENDLGVQITYAVQEEPKGTGNALWQAKDFVKDSFIVLWGNKAGSKKLVAKMIAKQKEGADAVFVGKETQDPSSYGIFRLQGEKVLGIVEKPESGNEPSNIAVSGARLLSQDFFSYYEKLADYHQVDLIDATNAYLQDKQAFVLLVKEKGLTLKYPWDVFGILDFLFTGDYFAPHIASTASLARNVMLKGPIYVGENTEIAEGTIIEGPVYIGNNCKIGYHNVIRGPVNIEDTFESRSFAEIKGSVVQDDVHMASGFLGDSIAASGCRFGAGFITGNRRLDRSTVKVKLGEQTLDTRLERLGVIAGANSKLGIHAGTMPGVLIGSNCIVGPGTHVFENIQDNTTFYTKFDNVQK